MSHENKSMMMRNAFIIDTVRTPIGKYGGALSAMRPDDMLAHVIKALLKRNSGIDVNEVEDVIAGCANQAGEDNRNVARMAALLAGLPVTVGGNTVNRLCASGLQAIMESVRTIACGDAEIMIACGVESMTRAPFVMAKSSTPFERNPQVHDSTLGWRFINNRLSELYYPFNMGETAENVARQWNISRYAQDEFAIRSQQNYAAALKNGKWKDEIISITIDGGNDPYEFKNDEHPRSTSMDKLAQLKPAFAKDGTVTAGNSSGINDGAAAMLIASENAVKKYGLHPFARIVSMAIAGVEPAVMGIGPVPATKRPCIVQALLLETLTLLS